MENFKQKFIDTAYTKFGAKANESINFEQAFAIIDEIEQFNISNAVWRSEQLRFLIDKFQTPKGNYLIKLLMDEKERKDKKP